MNPLLEQFLLEAREALEDIAQKLLQLEDDPANSELLDGLFRLAHTLKGNSGLFDFGPLTRVMHAAEDLLDKVRAGRLVLDAALTDDLLEAMDFVGRLLDTIGKTGALEGDFAAEQQAIATRLRARLPLDDDLADEPVPVAGASVPPPTDWDWVAAVPEAVRARLLVDGLSARGPDAALMALRYIPEPECFFKGEDPLLVLKMLPGLQGLKLGALEPWPEPLALDVYRANLVLDALSDAPAEELAEHMRYVAEQVALYRLPVLALALPTGDPSGGPVYGDFVDDALERLAANDLPGLSAAVSALLEMVNPALWMSSALRWVQRLLQARAPMAAIHALLEAINRQQGPDWYQVLQGARLLADESSDSASGEPALAAETDPLPGAEPSAVAPSGTDALMLELLATQRRLLDVPLRPELWAGRLASIGITLRNLYASQGDAPQLRALEVAMAAAEATRSFGPLAELLDGHPSAPTHASDTLAETPPGAQASAASVAGPRDAVRQPVEPARAEAARPEGPTPTAASHVLKVPMAKVDRLMDLIGEMVVAKNALPYLADRAEQVFGSRELSREIKSQYAVINRIAEEMQDGIMQVRMLPMSAVFQRFPRLVRDVARQLGKQVRLVVEGDDTEADKNIVESLGDPLIHILRNSLDHGIEAPEARQAAGKPALGSLKVSARQEGDRVHITVQDDGKGIDPAVVKLKAFEKGLIDEARLESLTDAEAVQLVFAAGFSTAAAITDLSGRGVGMDVVRASIAKMGGRVQLSSVKGEGTRIELALPLSVTISNVMMIHLAGQRFGVPMDAVVETVRVHVDTIHQVKNHKAVVLRNQLVPLFGADTLLRLNRPPVLNPHGEYAVLLVRVGADIMGLLVDGFDQTVDIILKPLEGPLAGLPGFAGTALLGDGSVLLVLDLKELI